jgi:hypothetical protein
MLWLTPLQEMCSVQVVKLIMRNLNSFLKALAIEELIKQLGFLSLVSLCWNQTQKGQNLIKAMKVRRICK